MLTKNFQNLIGTVVAKHFDGLVGWVLLVNGGNGLETVVVKPGNKYYMSATRELYVSAD